MEALLRRTKTDALETRNLILDAAETVFHREGVARASLADIASAANVTRGAVYWHFSGKADLFRAMTERVSAPEEAFFVAGAERTDGKTLSNLKVLSLELLRRFAANERAQRVHEILLFRSEHIGELGDVIASRRDTEKAFDEAVLAVLRSCGESGALGPGWSPEVASTALRCALMGAISDWLWRDRSYDLIDVASSLLEALFASFERGRNGA